MVAISFPASPSVNDTFTANGKTWQWNGTFWSLVVSGASVADGSVSTAKIADSAITAAKIADGTIVAAEIANNAITTDKIAAGAVTAAKLGNDISLTPADGSITQAKLAATLSGITVTTLAGRSAAVPSPFTGQTIFLSDVTRLQVWNGSAWTFITNGAPGAPTSLSATALSTTSVSVSFTPGASAGASPINYKYSLSTNGGSTYGEPTALDPADITSPITISGLTSGQTYHIKLRAVSDFGDSLDSTATSIAVPELPSAPTSLSATTGTSTVSIAFTAGADGGSAITNYQYAISTNAGSTYGSFTALDPVDATTPITITGLTEGTAYSVKLKAVNTYGAGAESSAVSFVTLFTIQASILGAGGGGSTGNGQYAFGGGGGGWLVVTKNGDASTDYSVTVGTKGLGQTACNNAAYGITGKGGDSSFITMIAGGGQGGSSAGSVTATSSDGGTNITTGATTVVTNYTGGNGGESSSDSSGGYNGLYNGSLLGTYNAPGAHAPNGSPGPHATGNGNGGAGGSSCQGGAHRGGGDGSNGLVILQYPSARTITIGAGLTGTTTTVGSNKVTTITAGSGNVSWA